MNATDGPRHELASRLLALTLFWMPLAGVGMLQLLTGRHIGTGLQPAFLSAAGAWAILAFARPTPDRGLLPLAAALTWTLLGISGLWVLQDVGLAGELPWSKGIKQGVLLVAMVALALLPVVLLSRSHDGWGDLIRWERAASLGLLLSCAYGLVHAVSFFWPLPGQAWLDGIFSSNPSIASGSDELYLGHRFVGVPRVRSTLCEPLYFGSYLVAMWPITMGRWMGTAGWSRAWRGVALALAAACLLLTFSRGVYFALALQVAIVVATRPPVAAPLRRRLGVGLLAGGAAALLLVTVLTQQAPWELPALLFRRAAQTFASHDLSNLTRFYSWEAAWQMFLQRPFTGTGWGGFGFWYYRVAAGEATAASFGWPVANSVPLRLLAETGLVGLVLWAAVLARYLGRIPWRLDASSPRGDIAAYLLGLSVAGLMVQSLTFSQLNLPHLWLTVGLAAAVVRERGKLV